MNAAVSALDRPAARAVAAVIALAAAGIAGWLLYLDNREDAALAACIAKRSAAIEGARAKGTLPAAVATRFLARVAASCEAEAGRAAPGALIPGR